jgi:single-strand DNA-binding protein
MTMLKLQVIGNIGNDATIQNVNGRQAINFSVAHNEAYKNKDQIEVKETVWVNCTIWKDSGHSTEIAKYLKKGTLVYMEGKSKVELYEKEGKANTSFSLTVRDLKLLSSVNKENKEEPKPQTTQPASAQVLDGDDDNNGLPF